MTSKRVLVALSGGVDSSVAACLFQQQGYDVVGVFLRNGIEHHRNSSATQQGCCSVEDSLDAALVANQLGIPFHAINMETEFSSIIDYFAEEYLSGCRRLGKARMWQSHSAAGGYTDPSSCISGPQCKEVSS